MTDRLANRTDDIFFLMIPLITASMCFVALYSPHPLSEPLSVLAVPWFLMLTVTAFSPNNPRQSTLP